MSYHFTFGKNKISRNGPVFIIAEIGHNHQGNLDIALKMIKEAYLAGANAVKFQKRENKTLFTKKYYNKSYDNENSFGSTYGKHRQFLEFGKREFSVLKNYTDKLGIEFLCTPFDIPSVNFLEKIGIGAYKIASTDITNIPLIRYVAKLNKPMFVSTGAADLSEARLAYQEILRYHNNLVFSHCVSSYPTRYENFNLKVITTLKREFPKAIIGYSSHETDTFASVIAYMLGATVFEKHFTLDHNLKGTDHKFSLEPHQLKELIQNLKKIDPMLGSNKKILHSYEKTSRIKMGKSLYSSRFLKKGKKITELDISIKSPSIGLPPYLINKIIGKKLKKNLPKETAIWLDYLD